MSGFSYELSMKNHFSWGLLGCDAVWYFGRTPKFRRNILHSSLGRSDRNVILPQYYAQSQLRTS